jgi:exodeoxyribonuclease-3
MKIITWNCNMAFRKKAAVILALKPDILVVQECEHPDKLHFDDMAQKPTCSLWFGQNANKGMAIFSYSDFRFKLLKSHQEDYKMIVPIAVTGGGFDFTLFAIWANNPGDPDGPYVTQVWKAINHYKTQLRKKRTVLTGDFNSNTIWDRPRRDGNHSTVVNKLALKGIHSAYHKHFEQVQGLEQHPTFYLYKHADKPYHLDYLFASSDMLEHLQSVDVGDHDSWKKYSDHVPISVTFGAGLYEGRL